MYESEVNRSFEPLGTLPSDVRKQFAESKEQIQARTILPWGEHCTECNWPACYTTCELYSARQDGACRLFVAGMVRINHKGAPSGYLLKIQFKRWGKLWTVGTLKLLPMAEAANKERRNIFIGGLARSIPLWSSIKARVLRKVSYLRRRSAEKALPSADVPDYFLFECYNPNDRTIAVTFTIRLRGANTPRYYQRMISVPPGFVRDRMPFADIAKRIDTTQPFEVEVVPNDCENTVLYFGLLDFVKEQSVVRPKASEPRHSRKWKCIVWDLDNTLWEGILMEDGPEKIRIRQEVIDVIKETDRRGILHSIASKNSHDDAMKVLRMCGIDEYFLHPQINWQPKSESITRIVQLLNIGSDAVAFVDDQPFEREEVKAALPEIALIDATDSGAILGRAECQVPITEESKQRRLMYRQQQERNIILESCQGDYMGFLKKCEMQLSIAPLKSDNLERVYELAQRTNQMNFSGNRYPRAELTELLQSRAYETYVMKCTDRFGSYGIVGFALVDLHEPRLLDLMFSCRIQSKRVEHAFLGFLLKRFVGNRSKQFFANYRKTAKNAPSGKVFEEMGFEVVQEKEGVLSLVFKKEGTIPDDRIIHITDKEEA
jgi:FkbH-like protein